MQIVISVNCSFLVNIFLLIIVEKTECHSKKQVIYMEKIPNGWTIYLRLCTLIFESFQNTCKLNCFLKNDVIEYGTAHQIILDISTLPQGKF